MKFIHAVHKQTERETNRQNESEVQNNYNNRNDNGWLGAMPTNGANLDMALTCVRSR